MGSGVEHSGCAVLFRCGDARVERQPVFWLEYSLNDPWTNTEVSQLSTAQLTGLINPNVLQNWDLSPLTTTQLSGLSSAALNALGTTALGGSVDGADAGVDFGAAERAHHGQFRRGELLASVDDAAERAVDGA